MVGHLHNFSITIRYYERSFYFLSFLLKEWIVIETCIEFGVKITLNFLITNSLGLITVNSQTCKTWNFSNMSYFFENLLLELDRGRLIFLRIFFILGTKIRLKTNPTSMFYSCQYFAIIANILVYIWFEALLFESFPSYNQYL